MASSLKRLFGVKSNQNNFQSNEGVMNESEDPYALMNEFRSLYLEKIKAIEENCEEPTEAKLKTLQDWVDDLTEQNLSLIKTVEELEREALDRVNTFSSLATEVKETMHQDGDKKENLNDLGELQTKVSNLQEVIEENNNSLDACMEEIDKLSSKLAEKSHECDGLREQNERLAELKKGVNLLRKSVHSVNPIPFNLRKNKEIALEIKTAAESFSDVLNDVDTHQNKARKKQISIGKHASMIRTMTLQERLEELQREAKIINNELLEKVPLLQSPHVEKESLMEDSLTATKRLLEVQAEIEDVESQLRGESEVVQSILRRSRKSLMNTDNSVERLKKLRKEVAGIQNDLKTKTTLLQSTKGKDKALMNEVADNVQRLQDLQDEMETLPSNEHEFTSPKRTVVNLTSERLMLKKMQNEVENAKNNLKTKTDTLTTPEGIKSEKNVFETAVAALRHQELLDEIKQPERKSVYFQDISKYDIPYTERLEGLQKEYRKSKNDVKEKTEAFLISEEKKEEKLYEAAVSAIKLQDLQDEIEALESNALEKTTFDKDPVRRAEKFMDSSSATIKRLDELKHEANKKYIDLKAKTDALLSPDGKTNEALLNETVIDALRFQESRKEIEDHERDLRKKTEAILDLMHSDEFAKDPTGSSQRYEDLQFEIKDNREELLKNIAVLQTPEGEKNTQLLFEVSSAAIKLLPELEELETIQKDRDEKAATDSLGRPRLSSVGSFSEERYMELLRDLQGRKKELADKEAMIKHLEQSFEAAKKELTAKQEQLMEEQEEKEFLQEQNNKMKSSGDSNLLKLKLCELEKQLKEKKGELSDLKKENHKKSSQIQKQESRIDRLKCELDRLLSSSTKTEELLQKSLLREDSFKTEICRLQKEVDGYQRRITMLQDNVKSLEEQLEALHSSYSFEEPSRTQGLNEQIQCLLSNIKIKDAEIEKHMEQEKKLYFQISKMEHRIKDRDRQMTQMSDTLKKLSSELRVKSALLEKVEEENNQRTLQAINDALFSRSVICTGCNFKEQESSEFIKLKSKLKDMQEALTAEIADKHDEIRRLKDDVKELEDKLLQSDKQTQFRDDIIKELRKEVKMGKAKESLAEMLGLKGTPRALMKNRIEDLTGQIEEMRAHILSLEARLGECNLPAVLSLRSRLNNAEGSLLAMCNKMDYVRRYLENLKGDEELSMKCGLEALLNELRDDVEWNRQTRRNLSLDEGTSVIVISHRSRSLPDNSLHRLPAKTQSDSAVMPTTNKPLTTTFQQSLETFQECKNYIHTINELENDFDETDEAVLNTWNLFRVWSQNSSDNTLKEFSNIIKLCVEGNEALAKLTTQLGQILDEKNAKNNGCSLAYLEGNLIELGRYLAKANMVAPESDIDLNKETEGDEKTSLTRKISVVINDSLSLLYDMKKNNKNQLSSDMKDCLQEIMVSFSTILGSKKTFMEKLVSLQKQQAEFLQSLLDRVCEFNSGISTYHNTAENLKNEIRKLFSVLLTKENQIQKQYDEINNLKALLTSSDRAEHTTDEISSLRKVVSNKDLQLIEKEELIHNLRSLNYTLRRTKLSKSSPSICFSGELSANLEEKMQQLEDCMLNIKGNLSSVFMYLKKSQEKLTIFEDESRSLVQVLAITHQEITSYRETSTDGTGDCIDVSSLDEHLNNAASKVEQLLNSMEVFLCDSEKLDLNFVSEILRRKLMKLIFIAEFIKKGAVEQQTWIKTIVNENEEFKKKGSSKDDVIKDLNDCLNKTQYDLQALQEEYSNLKSCKEDMELRNQKVMEELQTKICTLQEAASLHAPTDSVSTKSWLFPWPHTR